MMTKRLLWLLFIIGCSADDPTQVMVQIQADSMLRSANGRLEIVVEGGEDDGVSGTVETLEVDPTSAADFPYVVALAPRGGDVDRQWRVTATLRGELGVVTGVARGSYDAGRVVQVDLFLTSDCIGISCGSDQTCLRGGCNEARVDVTALPDYEGPVAVDAGLGDDGGTDGGLDAGDAEVDAGDAGVDAGEVDAGEVDAPIDAPIDARLLCDAGFMIDASFVVLYESLENLTTIALDVEGPGAPTSGPGEVLRAEPPYRWRFVVTGASAGIHTLTIRADPDAAAYATCEHEYMP